MRGIVETVLYRAKRKDNGEWVEGYYVRIKRKCNPCECKTVHYIVCHDAEANWYQPFDDYYEIIPATLGRLLSYACYDGYQECERLFQNDIIGIWERHEDVDHIPPRDVALVTDEHSVTVAGSGRWFPQDTTRIRILGNAYDNPELLHGHDMRHFINRLNKFPGTVDEYQRKHQHLTTKYGIHGAHACCYMCNFENDFICHQYNGGCKRIDMCRKIREEE